MVQKSGLLNQAQALQRHGSISPGGVKDAVLVHMNKPELGLLTQVLGRDPTTNKRTGLLQFEPGGRSSDGHSAGHGPSGGGGMGGGGGPGGTGSTANHGNQSSPEGGGGSANGVGGGPAGGGPSGAVGNENAAVGMGLEGGTVTGALGPNGVTRSSVDAEHDLRSSLGLGPTDSTPRTFESPFTHAVATAQSPLTKVLNFFSPLGISVQTPKVGIPSTYSMGQPSLGINPARAIGSLAGMAMGPMGMAVGPVAGAAYSHLGGQDVSLGGVGSTSEGSGLNGTGVRSGTAEGNNVSSGPQGAGHVGNGGSGPTPQDYIRASTGQVGTVNPNVPTGMSNLGLNQLQQAPTMQQTVPGYGFNTPAYDYWKWG